MAERLENLASAFLRWKVDGIPPGVTIPSSLTKLRFWTAVEYGIFPIKSANDFVRTHAIHGPRIAEIAELQQELLALQARGPASEVLQQQSSSTKSSLSSQLERSKSEVEVLNVRLVTIVSQMHAVLHELEREKRRGEAEVQRYESSLSKVQGELAKERRESAELRRELRRYTRLSVVDIDEQ